MIVDRIKGMIRPHWRRGPSDGAETLPEDYCRAQAQKAKLETRLEALRMEALARQRRLIRREGDQPSA